MDITHEKLLQAYKKEKIFTKKKDFMQCIRLKSTNPQLLRLLDKMFCTYQCVRNWLDSFEKYGLEGLEDLPRSGRPPLISHKTLQKIEQEFKRISDGMTPKKTNAVHI